MIMSTDRKLVVGIEIGTTKVVTLIGEILKDEKIKIIGIGLCASYGIDQGRINNLDTVVQCIKKSIHQAENMADCQITSVYLSLSNKYIKCQNEVGMVTISKDEVTKQDIKNVIKIAKSVHIFHKHHILHVIPQEYYIDRQSGIKNPIGLSGLRMQVKAHLITCHNNISKNLVKAIEKCNLKVNQVIFSGLASSKAVLTKDEQKIGVCMIDMGGGTIDFIIYINDCIEYSQVIPYAGNIVTSDIAYAFSTSYHDAENLKTQYGAAQKTSSDISQNIDLFNADGSIKKTIKQDMLIEVIESRYIELLSLVNKKILYIQKKLYNSGLQYQIKGGVVLTGGASKIKRLHECAEKIFQKKIRIAHPFNISGLIEPINQPNYSTVVGLLKYGKEKSINIEKKNNKNSFIKKWFVHINNWFKKEF
ncbi:cell division protein FtsA [Buchnera aphidicola]|uniref:cell division protein FtsA n=1 Tax=Buchnera aphidicola TaxID=9 RepID=UPI0034649B7B